LFSKAGREKLQKRNPMKRKIGVDITRQPKKRRPTFVGKKKKKVTKPRKKGLLKKGFREKIIKALLQRLVSEQKGLWAVDWGKAGRRNSRAAMYSKGIN